MESSATSFGTSNSLPDYSPRKNKAPKKSDVPGIVAKVLIGIALIFGVRGLFIYLHNNHYETVVPFYMGMHHFTLNVPKDLKNHHQPNTKMLGIHIQVSTNAILASHILI